MDSLSVYVSDIVSNVSALAQVVVGLLGLAGFLMHFFKR